MKNWKKIVATMMTSVMVVGVVPVNVFADNIITDPEIIKMMTPVINIQAQDESGNPLTGSDFELRDDKNEVVASWTVGNEKKADLAAGVYLVDNTMCNLYTIDLSKVCEKSVGESVEYSYYDADNILDKDSIVLKEGRTYKKEIVTPYNGTVNVSTVKVDDSEPVLTVPGNTIYILNNSEKSKATFTVGNMTRIWDEYDGDNPTLVEKEPGEYTFAFSSKPDGYGGGNARMTVSDQPTEYIKTSIHLADVFTKQFTEDGQMILDEYFREMVGAPYIPHGGTPFVNNGEEDILYADFCVMSGSLIQTPEVDENGDIEFYVLKSEKPRFRFETSFGFKNGGGGGIVSSGTAYKKVRYELKTPTIDKSGITLQGLKEGKYTLVQKSHDDKMIPSENKVIEVTNPGTIEHFVVTNKVKVKPTTQAGKEESSKTETPTTTTQVDKKPDVTVEKPAKIENAEELILDPDIDKKDGELSPFYNLKLQIKTGKKKSKHYATLSWKKIANADGYIIYGAKCGKNQRMKKLDTITNNKTTKWTQSKLKKGTYYKYIVVAYKGDEVITTSKSVHATTPGGKKGNPEGIKVKKNKMTLKVNKTQKINAKVVAKKKYSVHIAKFRYESSNPSVATVSNKGKVKAVSKGAATIYVYTQNGLYKKIKVKVK